MYGSSFINEECSPMRSIVFFAHEFFQSPDSECLVHGFVLVTRQIKGEIVFVDELKVFLSRIRAHAQHLDAGLLQLTEMLSDVASLCRATWRHVARIKVKCQFLAFVVGHAADGAVLNGGLEIRSFLPRFQWCCDLCHTVITNVFRTSSALSCADFSPICWSYERPCEICRCRGAIAPS